MNARRVVITGVGLASPIGHSFDAVSKALQNNAHGIMAMPEWDSINQLGTRLAAPVRDLDFGRFSRKVTRTMGRVALLATHATSDAIADAGLDEDTVRSGRTGMSYGSTHGSSQALEDFTRSLFAKGGFAGLSGTAYLKIMSHTCAANLAQCFGITGRIVPSIAACASGSQAIGFGYENIRFGLQDVMLCGGAEELHFVHAGVFDILFATSTAYNDRPDLSPRPFDVKRDGLVVGEGAGTLVLEEYERAKRRGAHIYAEVIGFGTNCDGTHVTSPSHEGMAGAMRLALADAKIASDRIDYVNAHGTATELGDIAETTATLNVLGPTARLSSTKGNTGHTLGACGALEAIFSCASFRDQFIPCTRNLTEVDPRCASLAYVMNEAQAAQPNVIMSNNFAFGGINTSLVLERV